MNPNNKSSGKFFGSFDHFSIFEDGHSNMPEAHPSAGIPTPSRYSKTGRMLPNSVYPLATSTLMNKASTEFKHERTTWQKGNEDHEYEQENAIGFDTAGKEFRSTASSMPTYKTNQHSVLFGNKPYFQDEKSGSRLKSLDANDKEAAHDSNKMEVARLQSELDKAKGKLAKMDQELAKTRTIPESGHNIQGSSGHATSTAKDITEEMASKLSAITLRGGVANPHVSRGGFQHTETQQDDNTSFEHDLLAQDSYQSGANYSKNAERLTWINSARSKELLDPNPYAESSPELLAAGDMYKQMSTGSSQPPIGPMIRSSNLHASGLGPTYNQSPAAWNTQYYGTTPNAGYIGPATPMTYSGFLAGGMPPSNQTRVTGTSLSPTAAEFTGSNMLGVASQPSPWNVSRGQQSSGSSTYMGITEPMNYRRLLDRNVSCNWKYIVDKIVCNNDQQASIFLQQKLKLSTPEHKYELVEAIIAQAYSLMINRFGNFLIQRCFEHGTLEQVVAIAEAIRGNTLTLSMDAFGCHVVQKAFDVVPEEYKAIMVHELLRRIPETVIHRYACHVWQKLFELRWNDSPPQIMKYVNEALRGMWHEVALGETGSLVVQNIFENCLEEDKRPCINEVLASIDIISRGQFGNWCIQHVCEHGAPADRSRAIEHVLRFATEYSIDQFASKVVEKCLKVAGIEFLDRYLEKVCEAQPDRPRMPLIDIAGDQYGNYLIQFILVNADAQHRELVAQHVRKHMVSLRGSKFGSRVAMLCCNPTFSNRAAVGAVNLPPNTNDRFFQQPTNTGITRANVSMPGPFHR